MRETWEYIYKQERRRIEKLGVSVREKRLKKVWGTYRRPIDGQTAYIDIEKSLTYRRKLLVLLHEIGHHICAVSDCSCLCPYDVVSEYHAIKYSLDRAVRQRRQSQQHRWRLVLRDTIEWIKQCGKSGRYEFHSKACCKITKEHIWRKATRAAR